MATVTASFLTRDNRSTIWRGGLLAALMLAYVALAPTSLVHTDLARDIRVANDILDGKAFPLLGPLLAGQVHLGPGWYYLLALLLSLGHGWQGGSVLLYLLAALQFPLAYLAGKAWYGRAAGLTWSFLLLLPSWSLFEQVFPTHTLLTAALVLAVLLAAMRFFLTGKTRYLHGGALLFGVAIHAHPTALILAPVLLAQLAHALGTGRLKVRTLVAAAALFALPFLPMLAAQWQSGAGLFAATKTYLAADRETERALSEILPVVWQLLAGGFEYWMRLTLDPSGQVARLSAVAVASVLLGALAAVTWSAWRGELRLRIALAAMAAGLLVLLQMRGVLPYYMLTAPRVLLLGVLAGGFAAWPRFRTAGNWLIAATSLACLASYLAVGAAVNRMERTGEWPFAFLPLFDVKREPIPTRPLALQIARAFPESTRWMCAQGPLTMHGAYATALLLGYGLEATPCAPETLMLGGADERRAHWVGLSRAMWAHIGRGAEVSLGAFELARADRILAGQGTGLNPLIAGYPPIPNDRSQPDKPLRLDIVLQPEERLVITHLGFAFVLDPIIHVRSGDAEITPIATDSATWVYRAPAGAASTWQVDIRAVNPTLLDFAVF